MSARAFQDLIGPENHCHGCGPENPKGHRIKSYWDGDEAVCHFTPQPHHCAGSTDVVNGGIIASLIDCHSINFAMAEAYRREGREIGSDPKIWYVTANLNINYRAGAPIANTLELRARISKIDGRKTWIACTLSADGKVCADAEVLAIRIQR